MTSIQCLGEIKDGKLILFSRKRFEADVKECKDVRVIVTIRKWGRRSLPQNNYWHGVVVEEIRLRLKELGHRLEHEDVHEMLKIKFLPVHIIDEEGVILATHPGSTATLNKPEFGELIDRVIEWAATTLCISIPLPTAKNEMNFE